LRLRPAALSRPLPALLLAMVGGIAIGQLSFGQSPLLVLTLLVVVPTLLVTLRAPLVGLVAFAFVATLLPFAVLPLRIVVAPTLVDLALTTSLFAVAARILTHRAEFRATPVQGWVLVFVGLAFVSLLLGTGYARLNGEQLRLFFKLINSVLLIFTVTQVVQQERDLVVLVRALIVGGIIAAVIGLAIYALSPETAAEVLSALGPLGYPTGPDVLRPIAETTTLRATGTSVDPNVFGGMLMLVATLLVAQLIAPHPVIPRGWSVVGSVAVLAALGLSYSRSAWVGLAAAVLLLAIFKARRLWIGIVVGGLVLIASPTGRNMLGRLQSGFGAQDPAAAMRLVEYRDAIRLIRDYPLFGVGFGDAPASELYIGVSNLFLIVAEHMGLVGLAVLIGLLVKVGWASLSARPARDTPRWGMLAGLEAAFVAMLVAGMFDHYFFNLRFPHMVGLFWLMLGLYLCAAQSPVLAAAPVPSSPVSTAVRVGLTN
jgi:polysaccharide biosynthesis protein PslJ